MTSVLRELRSWSATLPYWEQAALEKIVTGVQFSKSDYNELLQYLLEDNGLAEPVGKRPELQFPEKDDILESSASQMKLLRIFNTENVNALVGGQTLTFGQALTAIFGANGSGKSGYVRVLGCAGFTRGDEEVLSDIRQMSYDTVVPSADIEISDGTSTKVIHYQVGSECQELSQFYVFDSASVRVHLTGSNAFSFSPAGLSCLTQLAGVTDKVRDRLNAKIEECTAPHDFGTLFQGESDVVSLITDLNSETNLEELKNLATLTPEEEEQFENLDIRIAELKTKDISEQLSKLRQTIEDLQSLMNRLLDMTAKLDDDKTREITEAVNEYCKRQLAVQCISIDQFKSKHFAQVGSDIWYQFIKAAKELAKAEQAPDKPYPQDDDHCLLCQQQLSPEAREFLLRLWDFLESKAQSELHDAQKTLEEMRCELDATDLGFFDDQLVSYRHLQEHDQGLLVNIVNYIEVCRQRKEIALRIIDTLKEKDMPEMADSGIADIEVIIKKLEAQQCELEEEDPTQKISELKKQLLTLQHRKIIGENLSRIQEYVQRHIWAKKAAKIGGSTSHITRKYKELFENLVTDRYLELFAKTLSDLKRPLKVTVKTTGRKGETRKQIILETDSSVQMAEVEPEKVLSEGEKRAVALADFLTEVALDTTSGGIILDDPVTSLDLEWRDTIASLLVAEAEHRQVIVFTHDLPFLYRLKQYAEQESIEIVTHWIKRGDNDGKPGYVYLDNSPALEREYRKAKKAREIYIKAKDASPVEQENLLSLGFGALRAAYEAFIIFELFNEVIMRFDERVSFGRLKGIVWDESIVDEVVRKYELLSRYIEGHLHGDLSVAGRPTCETLNEEIKAFDALRKKLKGLKKS
jgi:energy-coupling factor transporter ATP-binding protein EcfA2